MDEALHKILKRQIKNNLGEHFVVTPELESLLKAVSETYNHFDEDRIMVNHSMDEMSKELLAINKELKNETINLEARTLEAENMNKYMINRELTMIDLKKQLKESEDELDGPALKKRLKECEDELLEIKLKGQ